MSPSSAKTLTVSKKSNVLDKIPPRGPKSSATQNSNSSNNNNNNNSSAAVAVCGIDVSPIKSHHPRAQFKCSYFYFYLIGKPIEGAHRRIQKAKR